MDPVAQLDVAHLDERDEHEWLVHQSAAAAEGDVHSLDLPRLAEYLHDMAKRDEREVLSRLVVLLHHLLKASYQPERMSGSWLATVREQQRQLNGLFASKTLRNYGDLVFADAYGEAREVAAFETGLPLETFPDRPLLTLTMVLITTPVVRD